jgi:hypothetical protein
MRRLIVLLALPAILLAASNALALKDLRRLTYLDNGQAGYGTPAPWLSQRINPVDGLGRIDTVGGTTYDWQTNGPAARMTAFDPQYGTHVVWMWSAEPGTPWSDRNMRYNYHDGATWQYNIGPDILQWGLNAFTNRAGYGSLDIDPVTGCEYICAHQATSALFPAVSRDLTPGAGVFEIDTAFPTLQGFLWPAIGLTGSEKVHIGMINDPANTDLYYTSITWPDWLSPALELPTPAPEPGFPTQSIATSHSSNKVCISWESDNDVLPNSAYYKVSDDDGITWGDPVEIPAPPAFTPVPAETLGPSFHISSITPFYDTHDNLHIAASVFCAATESTLYYYPTEIWHWSQAFGWSKVARAGIPDSMMGDPGYNTISATRPTMAEGADGEFMVVWEQFDPYNAEPTTARLRADIWAARSEDFGATWGTPTRLTDPDETSKRFPSVAPKLVNGDTLLIGYLVDLVAGFVVQDEGASTSNPWVVQRVWKGDLPVSAVAEQPAKLPSRLTLAATPNPFRGMTNIACDVPRTGPVTLTIHDAAGRVVRTIIHGPRNPGRYDAVWDGRADNGSALVPGVYFARLTTGDSRLTAKLTLQR